MSLRGETIKGIFWSGLSQGGRQASQFVTTAVLARLLTPNDFGLLAMAMVFVNCGAIFGEMGIISALIQKQDTHDRHYSSAFWLNVGVGMTLMILFILVSPFIVWVYKKPELQPVLLAISINFPVSSFAIVQQAILTKAMNFKTLALRDILAIVVSSALGIYLAFQGFGVWSLVCQSIASTALNSVLLWVLSSWRPEFKFAIADIGDMFRFSANVTGFSMLNYFARNIDQLLIGKFLGAEALGYYSLAYKLMLFPLQNISWVIGRVMFPALSKVQKDLGKVRIAYLRMIKAISLVSFPLMSALFAMAPECVRVILGPRWESVIIILRIFCACGVIQTINTLVGNIILSQGRADLQLKLGLLGAFFVFIAVLLGLQWGVIGIAMLYTVEQLVWSFYTQSVTNSLIGLEATAFWRCLKNSLTIAFLLLILIPIKHLLGENQLSVLSLSMFVGGTMYFCLLLAFREIRISSNQIQIAVLRE